MKKLILNSLLFMISCLSQNKNIINNVQYFPIEPIKLEKKNYEWEKNLNAQEWNQFAIQNYYEGDFQLAEYAFMKAIETSNDETPLRGKLNQRLEFFLNLLIFYNYVNKESDEFHNKFELYIKKYIEVLQKREDLFITSLEEINKRNLKILYNKMIEEYYKIKEKHSDNFLKIYFYYMIDTNKPSSQIIQHIENFSDENKKKEAYKELIHFYFVSQNYAEYLHLFDKIKKNNYLNLQNNFSDENLFIAQYNLWEKKLSDKIDYELLKKLEKKPMSLDIYKKYLIYMSQNHFIEASFKKILILPSCNYKQRFFQNLCIYNQEIEKKLIEKEILKSNNLDDFENLRKRIIFFN